MRTVWLFVRSVPWLRIKLSRFGICSRSDGTLGLSRRKCTLSKMRKITCSILLSSDPSRHPLTLFPMSAEMAGLALRTVTAARASPIRDEMDRDRCIEISSFNFLMKNFLSLRLLLQKILKSRSDYEYVTRKLKLFE